MKLLQPTIKFVGFLPSLNTPNHTQTETVQYLQEEVDQLKEEQTKIEEGRKAEKERHARAVADLTAQVEALENRRQQV